ncbi:MAG TPA: glycoside hydrolase family 3 C-terminal domain-containing protein [Propionicimonas sp.]
MIADARRFVDSLTLEQQASLLSGDGDWHTRQFPPDLPPAELGDGPHGLRTEVGVDMVWVPSTCFPTGSALGATWDGELVGRVAAAIGEEARALGVQLLLGPGINLKRTPLCGRNFEYFAEDPVLAGDLAAAYITGIQGTGVGACLKHFAANNQETERTQVSVQADERTLRELYLEGFRRAIGAARPWAVMCAYNRIGGIHASQNHWLLTGVLRDEWGYDGLMVSDWDAVHDPVAAVAAGLDLEMPGTAGRSAAAIVEAVQAGALDAEAVAVGATRVVEFVQRVLPDGRAVNGTVFDLGVEPRRPLTAAQRAALRAAEHHDLATEAAAAAATLLRNDGVLPLSVDSTQRIAVIGAHAVVPRIQGGGSAGVDPLDVDEPLAALRTLAGERVSYAQGYEIAQTDFYRELSTPAGTAAAGLRAEAVALARQADVIVAFVGLPLSAEVEAADRHDLNLPADQVELLRELCDLGTPLVVVLAAGSAVDLAPWHDEAAAILLTWLGGEAVGTATAQVLFGAREPGGRLGETYPLALAQTPGYAGFPGVDGRVHYDEGPFIGYRWYDAHGLAVRYPFGHGLSYTAFEYSDAAIEATGDGVRVRITVTNTGDRAGSEVVQLYVEPPEGSGHRPPRELRGFAKLHLRAGGSGQATFELGVRDFAIADAERGCWRQDAGTYRVVLAASSRDPRVALDVERRADSTSFTERTPSASRGQG